MNAAQRKELAEINEKLSELMAEAEALKSRVEDIAATERDKFDNMPEGLQESERGQKIGEAADSLDEVVDYLSTMIYDLDVAQIQISEVAE